MPRRVRFVAGDVAPSGAQVFCRSRARTGAKPRVRDRIRSASDRAVDMGNAGPRRENRPRAIAHAASRRRARRAGRAEQAMRTAGVIRTSSAAQKLPRRRAPIVFGVLLALFIGLLGRSLYLQRFDNAFLQEQGSSRYSREIEVPAHRGRIVDRYGEPLAISTPVKSIWAWPGKIEASPEQMRSLATALELTPAMLSR